MAYITPSVLVYQQLANGGGAPALNPDLNACIIGPANNVVTYIPGNTKALARSLATTFDYKQGTSALVSLPANITFELPTQKASQSVDTGSFAFYADSASVETYRGDVVVTSGGVYATTATANYLTDQTAGFEPKFKVGDTITLIRKTSGTVDYGNGMVTTVKSIVSGTVLELASSVASNIAAGTPAGTCLMIVSRTFSGLQLNRSASATFNASTSVVTLPQAELTTVHGTMRAGNVHMSYTAARTDLDGIMEIANIEDAELVFEDTSDKNPLGLGVKLALANTITSVVAVATAGNLLADYQAVLDLLEGSRSVYSIVPMTQNESIIAAVNTHVEQMSTPVEASWRISLINTAITTSSGAVVRTGTGTVFYDEPNNRYVLDAPGAQFTTWSVGAGNALALSGTNIVEQSYATIYPALVVDSVLSQTQLVILGMTGGANDDSDGTVSFSITTSAGTAVTKSDQSEAVKLKSSSYNSKRVIHVQPDVVGVEVNGVTKFLPGYYLCAALAGAIAGFPVQQGLTNISLAGITDLKHSNFYFTRSQLNNIIGAGTCMYAQVTQGGAPYCKHELTTDMSVLANREILKVKNLDYLSYYFHDLLKPFIGKWNITEDTLNIMRQVVVAACESLMSRKLPRIGAPLVGYNLVKLEQNAVNKDNIDIQLEVAIADPNNYTNLYLVV